MLYIISKVEEVNIVLRNLYTRMVKPERRVMATSMAHYQKGHTIEKEF